MLYLEAGSGAENPVNQSLIAAARDACDLPLIVGGGIRDAEAASKAADAGADWIVTGNLTEEFDDASKLQEILTTLINSIVR